MSYIVLARKYRPQEFDDLVGQLAVSQTLRNALESGRVAHAYIFSGPRGVGKTTTARILAKCLNCEKGVSLKPCNKCDSCVMISQGTSMQDVLEIDGASNRGIEQIRDLRESAKYAPTKSRYRIFIIDEAHQITKDAFGALLKTLEEPPAHVIFMMATTEVQKIPSPILSRCQRFTLRPISSDVMVKHIQHICAEEKVKIEPQAVADIVRFVEGSLRDALSLLDQALVFAPKGVTSQTLRDLLGLLPKEVVVKYANVVAEGNPESLLKEINELLQNGMDLTQLAKDLQEYYHALLLAKAGVKDPLNLDAVQQKDEAASFTFETLERHIRLLSRALNEMRQSENPRAVFEIYALKMAQKVLDPKSILERLEKLEHNPPAPLPQSSPSFSRPTQTPTNYSAVSKNISKPEAPAPQIVPQIKPQASASASTSASSASSASLSDSAFHQAWPEFLTEVSQEKQSLAVALEEAQTSFSNQSLLITLSNSFQSQLITRNLDYLKSAAFKKWSSPLNFEVRLDPTAAAKTAPAPLPPVSHTMQHTPEPVSLETENQSLYEDVKPNEAGEDVQALLKHFPGVLKKEKKS